MDNLKYKFNELYKKFGNRSSLFKYDPVYGGYPNAEVFETSDAYIAKGENRITAIPSMVFLIIPKESSQNPIFVNMYTHGEYNPATNAGYCPPSSVLTVSELKGEEPKILAEFRCDHEISDFSWKTLRTQLIDKVDGHARTNIDGAVKKVNNIFTKFGLLRYLDENKFDNKLEKIRNRLAKKIDKVLGTNLEEKMKEKVEDPLGKVVDKIISNRKVNE